MLGRTEVGGNHTDHQHGMVLAASINLDAIAIVGKAIETLLNLYLKVMTQFQFLEDLNVNEKDFGTTFL